nr:aldo/keto reductase [Bacteroidales bacterium]
MKNIYSRRKFLKSTLTAGVAIAGARNVFGRPDQNLYNAKGLPVAPLGKTGVMIPRIAIGLGSRFLTIKSTDEALAMCTYALDNGLYYWDTAHSYVNTETGAVSEERLGRIVKTRRKEIFLSTKIDSRDPEEAKRKIELSLKRLQTDHLDMMMIHAVESPEDVANIIKSGGVLDLFEKMKEQGVTRFIGFSGHANVLALKSLAETRRFDNVLFAMNHYGDNKDNRQGLIVPVARQLGMGIMLMKSVRPKETIKELNPAELVRYA